MRRDVCYMFPVSVERLYKAYLAAATNDRFRREPEEKPYHTMSFGLNFSMKYNFNGGACTLRFMPYQGGSAVNMRFSIAQLVGARYEKYAQDLTETAAKILDSMWRTADINVDDFMLPQNMITPNGPRTLPAAAYRPEPAPAYQPEPAPAYKPEPAPAPQPAVPAQRVCAQCGKTIRDGDRFCTGCGHPVAPAERFCGKCGAKAARDAAFCGACGNKL